MKLGIEGKWVGRAMSRSRANGANSFCRGLHGYGGTFMETILFCPEKQTDLHLFLKSKLHLSIFLPTHLNSSSFGVFI